MKDRALWMVFGLVGVSKVVVCWMCAEAAVDEIKGSRYSVFAGSVTGLAALVLLVYWWMYREQRVCRFVVPLWSLVLVWDFVNVFLVEKWLLDALNATLTAILLLASLFRLFLRSRPGTKQPACYDPNASSLSLHIDEIPTVESGQGERVVTAIASYAARQPGEVSLCQFERVTLVSQRKNSCRVRKKSGQEGLVPAVLLKISQI